MTKPGGYLTIESGSLAGQQIAIEMGTRPVFIIGSDPRCDLQLTDGTIAPAHLAIAFKDGVYYAKPRYITQPVMINGNRVKNVARINSGDTLRVGDVTLMFQTGLAAVNAPPPKLMQLRGQEPASKPVILPKKTQKPVRKKTPSRSSSNNWTGVIAIMVSVLVLLVMVGFVAMDQINKAAPNPKYAHYAQGSVTLVVFHAPW